MGLPQYWPVAENWSGGVPGDAHGIAGGVDLKELRRRPHLDGVTRDIDGQVADDENVALVGIGLEAAPLAIEEVLRHLVVEHTRRMVGADLGGSLTAGAELRGPLQNALRPHSSLTVMNSQ